MVNMSKLSDEAAIENLREYLRIPSVHPNINYDKCVEYLKRQSKELELPIQVFTFVPGKPIVVISWVGKEPALPAIMLNSHMDVVPVFEEYWTHKPFGADMDEKGNIYARGAQDMKCVGIWYLEAIRRLRHENITLKRTVHVAFVPDEEIGGADGMAAFVKAAEFKNLNIGFCLDEGMPDPGEPIVVFYGEKTLWQIRVNCHGPVGHGSILFKNTAGDKLRYIIDKFMDLRTEEMLKMSKDTSNNQSISHGSVTSINLTKVSGGVQNNVVPEKLSVTFDMRIAVTVDIVKFEQTLNDWCKEAGPSVSIEFDVKSAHVPATRIDDTNPFWVAFKNAAKQSNIQIQPIICPAATDMRFVRNSGIPALGFSPLNNTTILVHDHDEFINKDQFVKGIGIYKTIITSVANA